jgi:hypothetical protein
MAYCPHRVANLNSSPAKRTYVAAEYAWTLVFPGFGHVRTTAAECEMKS